MTQSSIAQDLLSELSAPSLKLGDIKKLAKEIKRDHELALALWSSEKFFPRLLSVLIVDKKELTAEILNDLAQDLQSHPVDERTQIADWLLANQLTKSKKTISLLESWQDASPAILRRLFWYHQARLRWTGQAPPDNSSELLTSLESDMESSEPEVQWAMNFAACQIGLREPKYRSRCIKLGERLGLYKDESVSRGCTPNYLPEFIRIEAAKLKQ